jgi:hypothetical protein
VQLPPSLRPSPRGWMLPAFFQVLQIVTFCVLLGVGLHIDHARIPTGPITWLAALGLASIWAPFIRRQWRLEQDWRREQERRLAENPEAQLGAPVVRRAGITNVTEAIAEIGALADTRLQRQLAEGKERRDDDRDDQAR